MTSTEFAIPLQLQPLPLDSWEEFLSDAKVLILKPVEEGIEIKLE